jgi:hypothetical protein
MAQVKANVNTTQMGQGKELSPGIFEKFAHPKNWLRDRIKIFQQEGPGGSEPVYLSVNGFSILIPREIECDVARPFVNNLRDAVVTVTEQDDKGMPKTRNVPRYNWQMIQEAVNLKELQGDNT